MRLVALNVENFRSYRDRTTLRVGEFTAIMGRNDVGKSTLLDALEIFFGGKPDQTDPCVYNEGKIVEISCTFDLFPSILTLDETSETNLAEERLLNAAGQLEIVKRFDCRTGTIKEEVFARANHPTAEHLTDLLQLKNADLKRRGNEVGVDLDGVDVDQRSNASLRRAIRASVGEEQLQETLVALNSEDGKKVWSQLQRRMPVFALFRADRPSRDDDPEVADPMKMAVTEAIRAVEDDLEVIKQRVQESVMVVASRTLQKLQEMDPGLAQELTPTFKAEPKWDGFKLSLTGDDQIPINKRGSGVRRLILLNFFRAEVERRRHASEGQRVIYAIEEPESSQHPDNQIMLVEALTTLAQQPGVQVFMTTHVPAVAGLVPVEAVRFVSRDDQARPFIEDGTDDVLSKVADSLGVYPDKRAKVAIYVEGPHDVNFLTHISALYARHDPTLPDIANDHRIAFIPTGGGNLKHWVEKRYLEYAGLVEVHIYDRDTQQNPKYLQHVDRVNGRGSRDIAFLTNRREMENYLHPDCVREEYAADCAVALMIDDWCDVPALVAECIHNASGAPKPWSEIGPEKQSEKSSRTKARLNAGAASRMTFAQLRVVDANGEILGWLRAVAERAA